MSAYSAAIISCLSLGFNPSIFWTQHFIKIKSWSVSLASNYENWKYEDSLYIHLKINKLKPWWFLTPFFWTEITRNVNRVDTSFRGQSMTDHSINSHTFNSPSHSVWISELPPPLSPWQFCKGIEKGVMISPNIVQVLYLKSVITDHSDSHQVSRLTQDKYAVKCTITDTSIHPLWTSSWSLEIMSIKKKKKRW